MPDHSPLLQRYSTAKFSIRISNTRFPYASYSNNKAIEEFVFFRIYIISVGILFFVAFRNDVRNRERRHF